MDHHSRESKYVSKTSTAYGVNFSAGEFARGVIEKVGVPDVPIRLAPRAFSGPPAVAQNMAAPPAFDRTSLLIPAFSCQKTEPSNSEVDKSSSDEEYFPFSITAGIEKGAKNRCVDQPLYCPFSSRGLGFVGSVSCKVSYLF